MPSLPQISDAEWDVMKVLWDRGSAAAQDVVDALAVERNWAPGTVKTLLGRLVKKGAAKVEADGRRFLYRPACSRDAVVRAEAKSFLRRVFDGAVTPALVHLVRAGNLTRKDIDDLKKVLEREAKP
ncbi:MAG TPA: BlaI/MecI/CopY family transcriptional regulator [Tepidisphaeraceae bacterium]|nr:BlaI/MecI/CopY family transcriptional regulator [Tepidisphaeraceae bacterium]